MIVEPISWSEFLGVFRWKQGEHVSLIGPTGAGKTTLALQLLPMRSFVVVLAAKPRDPLIDDLKRSGYHVTREWPPPPPDITPRVVLWPKLSSPSDVADQREQFREALVSIYQQKGYCVYVDELRYVTDTLGLEALVELLWQHGRSLGISVLGGTQRPARVPLSAYSQATWLFFWKSNDAADLKRLREIGGYVDPKALQAAILELGRHDVLAVNTRDGQIYRTKVDSV